MRKIDILGKRYGRLVAVKFIGSGAWEFKCDCGNIVQRSITRIQHWKRRLEERSCGCATQEGILNGNASAHRLYNKYKYCANKRNLCFKLNEDCFLRLTKQNCYYCGSPPLQRSVFKKGWGAYIYNGIDRKDNKQGYTLENSVPCCKICNTMKMGLTYDVFIGHILKIIKTQS